MKKTFALFLALAMLLAMIPAAQAEVDWKNPPAAYYLTPEDFPNTDLSQHYEIQMFSSNAASEKEDETMAELNRILEERGFNTSVRLIHVLVTGASNMYAMTLSSGEVADVYFTAPWREMWTQAAKESWMVLEPEWIEKYMPITWKTQHPESWSETTYKGDIIAVPGNYCVSNQKFVVVRQDLMEKYGFETLENWEDYKKFLLTIAEKETPESGIFGYNTCYSNASQEMWKMYWQQFNWYPIYNEQWFFPCKGGDVLPDFKEDVKLFYETDEFRDYAHQMVELRKAGVWSQSALASDVSASTNLEQGISASSVHNATLYYNAKKAAENNPGTTYGFYEIFPDAFFIPECYANNNLAIPYSSANPERAAMLIDLMKNDFQIGNLCRLGVEGIDWVDNGDNTYTTLGTSADLGSIGWALKVDWDYTEKPTGEFESLRKEYLDRSYKKLVNNPCVSFVFDTEPVKAELAAVQALLQEYTPVLMLGFRDDVDECIDELMKKCYDSGLQKLYDEMEKQYEEWKATR